MNQTTEVKLSQHDALIVVDIQNDFLEGGALAVQGGNAIIPVVNAYIAEFSRRQLPVFLTRDWHPADHRSFTEYGGVWPVHCVAGSKGAEFSADLSLPDHAVIVSTGVRPEQEGYSGFENPDLQNLLQDAGATRLFICGIATDYCVLHTVCDALKRGFEVFLLLDAIAAVNVRPDDGRKAERTMLERGARPMTLEALR